MVQAVAVDDEPHGSSEPDTELTECGGDTIAEEVQSRVATAKDWRSLEVGWGCDGASLSCGNMQSDGSSGVPPEALLTQNTMNACLRPNYDALASMCFSFHAVKYAGMSAALPTSPRHQVEFLSTAT
jgi:hypothetical protein